MAPTARTPFASKVARDPPKARRVYVASDIDSDEDEAIHPLNKCTKEAEPRVQPQFDYDRYHEFCRLKNLQLKLHRLLDDMGDPEGEKSQGPPSDKFLKKEFVRRYGPVDFSDPLMTKRLEVMKHTLMEAANLPLDEDDILNQLLDLGIEGAGGKKWIYDENCDPEDMLNSHISNLFTWKELSLFSSFNPAKAEGDWFNLPRGDLRIIREKHFSKKKLLQMHPRKKPSNPEDLGKPGKSANSKEGPSRRKSRRRICKNPLKNLHLYDPKFEFCFKMPYRIFDTLAEEDDAEISKILAFRILEHLNQFPNGVTRNHFWETHYSKTKSLPDIYGMNIMQVFDYLPGEVHIVPETGTFPELVFPGFLEGYVDPSLILKRVWHSILCLMTRQPYIVVADLFQRLENEFGFKFNPCHWGYKPKDFLNWCLTYFGSERTFTVKRVTFYRNHITSTEDYFAVKSPFLLHKMEELSESGPKKRTIRKPPPEGTIRRHHKITHLSDTLSEGEQHLMDLIATYDPHRLSFELFGYQCEHFAFQAALQTSPFINDILRHPKPRDDQLFPGMYVMVHFKWRKVGWHRARIIWKEVKMNKYYLYGIDDGFCTHLALADIRFMPMSVAKEMAYAIPAQLVIKHPTQRRRWGSYNWESEAVELMDKYLEKGRCLVYVYLQSKAYSPALGCSQWSVQCAAVKCDKDSVVTTLTSISDTLYQDLAKWLKDQRHAKRALKAAIKPPQVEAVVEETPENKPNAKVPGTGEENKEKNIGKNTLDADRGRIGAIQQPKEISVQA